MYMICRLCLEDKRLQRESHIIPQFMYDEILSDDGYFYKVRKNTFKEYSSGKSMREFKTGEYDGNILCGNCENDVLNQKYEDYAAKVFQFINQKVDSFQNIEIANYRNVNDIRGKLIKNIDYCNFKLFLLSILWRANISNRDFFKKVNLGSRHNEVLREMIYDGNPKELEDYPCFICDLGQDQPVLKGVILPPIKIRRDGNIAYEFMISGLLYRFTISRYGRNTLSTAGIINPGNDMIIWEAPEGLGKHYFSQRRKYISKLLQT